MTDPQRLLYGPDSDLPARLLRAGAAEAPTERSLERTLAALGAAATTLGTAGAAGAVGAATAGKAATSLTLLGLAKWASVGVVSGVAFSLAAEVVRTPPVEPVVTRNVARIEAPPAPVPKPEKALLNPAPEPPASTGSHPKTLTREGPPATSNELMNAPLAAEVAFVDRGRSAFQRGDASAALEALGSYEREFPERRLLPEVLYLRMEALSASGDETRAATLARVILRDFAKSPHATRARAVLGMP